LARAEARCSRTRGCSLQPSQGDKERAAAPLALSSFGGATAFSGGPVPCRKKECKSVQSALCAVGCTVRPVQVPTLRNTDAESKWFLTRVSCLRMGAVHCKPNWNEYGHGGGRTPKPPSPRKGARRGTGRRQQCGQRPAPGSTGKESGVKPLCIGESHCINILSRIRIPPPPFSCSGLRRAKTGLRPKQDE
jgi:hypothetical protein